MSPRPLAPHLAALARAAALGTAAGAVPPPRPPALAGHGIRPGLAAEEALLDEAALAVAWEAGGAAAPAPATVPAHPAPADPRPECPAPLAAAIRAHLDAELAGARVPSAALVQALRGLARAGHRPPPAELPRLLAAAVRQRELAAAVMAAVGPRGAWLARLNPAWATLAPAPGPDDWEGTDHAARLAHLTALRARDPQAAAELLARDWKSVPSDRRAEFLAALRGGHGPWDAAPAALALKSKNDEQRRAGARLAAAIPDSQEAELLLAAVTEWWTGAGFAAPEGPLRPEWAPFGVTGAGGALVVAWPNFPVLLGLLPPALLAARLGLDAAGLAAGLRASDDRIRADVVSRALGAAAWHRDWACLDALAGGGSLSDLLSCARTIDDDWPGWSEAVAAVLLAQPATDYHATSWLWGLGSECLRRGPVAPRAADRLGLLIARAAVHPDSHFWTPEQQDWAVAVAAAMPRDGAASALALLRGLAAAIESSPDPMDVRLHDRLDAMAAARDGATALRALDAPTGLAARALAVFRRAPPATPSAEHDATRRAPVARAAARAFEAAFTARIALEEDTSR